MCNLNVSSEPVRFPLLLLVFLTKLGQQGRCQRDQWCKTKERAASPTSLIQRIHWSWPISHLPKSQVTRLVSLKDKTHGRFSAVAKKTHSHYAAAESHKLKHLWSSQCQVDEHNRADSQRDYLSHEIVWIKDKIGPIVVDQWQVTQSEIHVESLVQMCVLQAGPLRDDEEEPCEGCAYLTSKYIDLELLTWI